MYRIERISLSAKNCDSLKILEELQHLFESSISENPFFHPDFIKAALRHLAKKCVLNLAWEGDLLAACIPTMRSATHVLPLNQAFDHKHCFLHSPFYRSNEAILRCLTDTLESSISKALLFPTIDLDGLFYRLLIDSLNTQPWEIFTFNEYSRAGWSDRDGQHSVKLSNRNQKKLEKKRSRLHTDPLVTKRCSDTPTFIETFLKMEHAGWKGEQGTSLRSLTNEELFFREILSSSSLPHILHILMSSDDVFAATCSWIHGGKVFRFKTAFNREHAKCSPGALLEMDLIRDIAQTYSIIDGCCDPSAENMNRLYPTRIPIGSVLVVGTKSLRGKLASKTLSSIFPHRRIDQTS
jgi:hypothetical protein